MTLFFEEDVAKDQTKSLVLVGSVERGGFVSVDEDVHEREGALRGGVFYGVDNVFSQGVKVV